MAKEKSNRTDQDSAHENLEWLESLDYVYANQGPARVLELLRLLQARAQAHGAHFHFTANTPYINTIPGDRQPPFPGSREIERRIKSIIRWNAMAMVVRANRENAGIGGHISTYASSATLYEVGFNHLAKTIKGYGLGEAGEGRNVTHQQKKLNEDELRHFRSRFGIPIPDDVIGDALFYRPAPESEEIRYLKARRRKLGGYLPSRSVSVPIHRPPGIELYDEFFKGTGQRQVATTMVMVRLLGKLLADKKTGRYIVPIVPDEARTFGMEALFRRYGIYSRVGQLYEPVDKSSLLYYKEAKDGQILEEGITEAGSMSSFIAAGTAYASMDVNMVPFFFFYSMFGFQRIGDLIWASGDVQARGFLLGATAGRTTLAGEGLQHQDGHSHILAYPNPSIQAYDPAFAFEVAVIVREGLHRMLENGENVVYYLTIMNEFYSMPAMPEGVEEGILKGLYRFRRSDRKRAAFKAHLLGSGAILTEALKAQSLLEETYGVAADVWSVTSYKNLYRDAIATERWNRLNPEKKPRSTYIERQMTKEKGVFIAASDYLKALPASIAKWIPGPLMLLGTDGYGRSETRSALRDFFEVDARHIAFAALGVLAREGQVEMTAVQKARKELEIDPERIDPLFR